MSKKQQLLECDRLIAECKEEKQWNMVAYWEKTKEAILDGAIPVQ